jgi:PDZ domain-containing secreted protein
VSALGRLLSPFRLASAGLIVLIATVAILVTQGSNKYLEIPDNAHPLADLVQVAHAKTDADGGGIFYVDILLKPASLLESYVPYVRPEGSDLIDRTQIVEPGISEQERRKLDLATMKASQDVASVVALRELGYRVPIRPGGM